MSEEGDKQLDRIEKKLDNIIKSHTEHRQETASHRTEIAWLKRIMTGFFAAILGMLYKVFGASP